MIDIYHSRNYARKKKKIKKYICSFSKVNNLGVIYLLINLILPYQKGLYFVVILWCVLEPDTFNYRGSILHLHNKSII